MTSWARFLRGRLAEAQLALMLLTRLPAGRIKDPLTPMADACWAFPLAGLAVGVIAASALWSALWLGLPSSIAAGLALTAGVLATGGLHEDGLADLADGFGGGQTRDRKLEIMRDSCIGSYGALALILAIGLRWSATATLANQDALRAGAAIVAIAIASRAGLPVVLALLPPARKDGLGHATAGPTGARIAAAAAIGLLALALLMGSGAALTIALGQSLTLLLMARLALRQIGGQTGDVLGAMQQVTDLCALLALVWLGR